MSENDLDDPVPVEDLAAGIGTPTTLREIGQQIQTLAIAVCALRSAVPHGDWDARLQAR